MSILYLPGMAQLLKQEAMKRRVRTYLACLLVVLAVLFVPFNTSAEAGNPASRHLLSYDFVTYVLFGSDENLNVPMFAAEAVLLGMYCMWALRRDHD